MNKIELTKRMRLLLTDIKRMAAQSKYLGEDCTELECIIMEMEVIYGRMVDDYMARQIATYLREKEIKIVRVASRTA